jgi:hypothetical protein
MVLKFRRDKTTDEGQEIRRYLWKLLQECEEGEI